MKKKPKSYAAPLKPEGRHTKSAGGNFADKLQAYRDQHAQALFSSLGRLVASPFTSLMTVTVIALAIALAGGFYLLTKNLQRLADTVRTGNQISLYLREEISDTHAARLADSIRQNPDVLKVRIIGKKEGLEEFKTFSGFGSAIDSLPFNPLPVVLQVTPKNTDSDPQLYRHLLDIFKAAPEVEFAQVDTQWLERLRSILALAEQVGTLMSMLLGLGVVFIIGNTIRLELHNRRQEIIIAKLVGATNGFIQRPFLYTGFWIGFISGIMGWFIVTAIVLIVWQSVENLSQLYGGGFHIIFLNFAETSALLGVSALLGIAGSWGVLVYQLRHTRPDSL